jgi:hypothetical protein
MDGEPRNLVWAGSVGLLRDVEIRDCRILGRYWGWAKSKFRSLSSQGGDGDHKATKEEHVFQGLANAGVHFHLKKQRSYSVIKRGMC